MHPLSQATLMVPKESLLICENEDTLTLTLQCILLYFFSVRLRIKSFRVPELFVEIPETATVGSLKVTSLTKVFDFSFLLIISVVTHLLCCDGSFREW